MAEVTYGRLDRVLRSLGFSCRLLESAPKTRVYEHSSGAILMLPPLSDDQVVFPHHLTGVLGTLDNYRIASPLVFAEELQKVG